MSLKDNPILMQLKMKSIDEKKARGEYVESKENTDNSPAKKSKEKEDRKLRNVNLTVKKNQQSKNSDLWEQGTVRANEKGFGFLESDNRESYFIPPKEMHCLMNGDKISGRVVFQGEKSRVEHISLVEPFLTRFVARVHYDEKGKLTVVPDHGGININIDVVNNSSGHEDFKEGDWVIALLTRHALQGGGGHQAEIKEFIVHADDEQTPWWVVLRGLDLPKESPADLPEYDFKDKDFPRVDMTDKPFITIDSAKTQDMDDALYIESRENGGWNLYVAIADPTGYIYEGDSLDEYAAARAFSIYLPGRDIPMLTRKLSDDLCSLRENEERYVLVGRMEVEPDGHCNKNIDFSLAVIKSQGKLAYDDVSDYLEGCETDFSPNDVIKEQITLLKDFSKARYVYRRTNACVFKDKPDYEFVLNENGGLKEIKVVHKRTANGIVEEAMILANTCAGKFLADKFQAGIFNTHSGFDHEKIGEVQELLEQFNYPPDDIEKIETMDGYCKLKRWLYDSNSAYLDARVHKYSAFAEMSPVPAPHFGMGLDYYATWTSPIRKYGDMINHRLIKSAITGSATPKIPEDSTIESMNLARKLNRSAERQVKDWLYTDYLRPHIKSTVYEGEVVDITRGGIKVLLQENGARVFVPTSFMCNDKKRVDGNNSLGVVILDGNKKVMHLGDVVKVRLVEISESRSIIGELIDRLY